MLKPKFQLEKLPARAALVRVWQVMGGENTRHICDTYLFPDAAETFNLAENMKEFSENVGEAFLPSKLCELV